MSYKAVKKHGKFKKAKKKLISIFQENYFIVIFDFIRDAVLSKYPVFFFVEF